MAILFRDAFECNSDICRSIYPSWNSLVQLVYLFRLVCRRISPRLSQSSKLLEIENVKGRGLRYSPNDLKMYISSTLATIMALVAATLATTGPCSISEPDYTCEPVMDASACYNAIILGWAGASKTRRISSNVCVLRLHRWLGRTRQQEQLMSIQWYLIIVRYT
ncbi:hypothetical protein RRF57_012767 [Xylaria bambusicola]|uniref:Uncharacterized protein n=1 Tax=Xylaria bambusicola TaxID=326684 RepID=A0AAN7Z4S9_9PEZI